MNEQFKNFDKAIQNNNDPDKRNIIIDELKRSVYVLVWLIDDINEGKPIVNRSFEYMLNIFDNTIGKNENMSDYIFNRTVYMKLIQDNIRYTQTNDKKDDQALIIQYYNNKISNKEISNEISLFAKIKYNCLCELMNLSEMFRNVDYDTENQRLFHLILGKILYLMQGFNIDYYIDKLVKFEIKYSSDNIDGILNSIMTSINDYLFPLSNEFNYIEKVYKSEYDFNIFFKRMKVLFQIIKEQDIGKRQEKFLFLNSKILNSPFLTTGQVIKSYSLLPSVKHKYNSERENTVLICYEAINKEIIDLEKNQTWGVDQQYKEKVLFLKTNLNMRENEYLNIDTNGKREFMQTVLQLIN